MPDSYRDRSPEQRHRREGRDRDRRNRDGPHEEKFSKDSRDEHKSHRRSHRRDEDDTKRDRRDRRSYSRSRSRSPQRKRRRHSSHDDLENKNRHHRHSQRRHSNSSPAKERSSRSSKPLPSQNDAFTHQSNPSAAPPDNPKQKPNYAPSGLLAREANTVAGTVDTRTGQGVALKYHEPSDARLPPPRDGWRMYVFKSHNNESQSNDAGDEQLDTVALGDRSCWLFGREQRVVDYLVEHPSASKQHAVLQFRYTEKKKKLKGDTYGESDGLLAMNATTGQVKVDGKVRLYVIDLESANGTVLNGSRVPESRYVEVRSGDVLRFGESRREYVVLLPPGE